MEAPKWATLDHQVRNRLNRMERDLKSIPEKVILSVQKKEVPLHYKKTAALMNQYKSLRSKRIVLEVRKTIVYLRFLYILLCNKIVVSFFSFKYCFLLTLLSPFFDSFLFYLFIHSITGKYTSRYQRCSCSKTTGRCIYKMLGSSNRC